MTQEIIAVVLSIILATGVGVAVFIGNQKKRLTWGAIAIMIAIGITAGVLSWTYIKDDEAPKIIVRNIILWSFTATVLSKLIGRVINAVTNIPEKEIQKIAIDYARKRAGLRRNEREENTDYFDGDDTHNAYNTNIYSNMESDNHNRDEHNLTNGGDSEPDGVDNK